MNYPSTSSKYIDNSQNRAQNRHIFQPVWIIELNFRIHIIKFSLTLWPLTSSSSSLFWAIANIPYLLLRWSTKSEGYFKTWKCGSFHKHIYEDNSSSPFCLEYVVTLSVYSSIFIQFETSEGSLYNEKWLRCVCVHGRGWSRNSRHVSRVFSFCFIPGTGTLSIITVTSL